MSQPLFEPSATGRATLRRPSDDGPCAWTPCPALGPHGPNEASTRRPDPEAKGVRNPRRLLMTVRQVPAASAKGLRPISHQCHVVPPDVAPTSSPDVQWWCSPWLLKPLSTIKDRWYLPFPCLPAAFRVSVRAVRPCRSQFPWPVRPLRQPAEAKL